MTLDDLRKIAEAAASVRTYTEEYAEFIATFNPSKVLELLDQIEQLRADVSSTEEMAADYNEEIVASHARLAAVEKLHYPALMPKPRGGALKVCAHCARQMHAVEKRAVWPCLTIKAVRGE